MVSQGDAASTASPNAPRDDLIVGFVADQSPGMSARGAMEHFNVDEPTVRDPCQR